MTLPTITLSEPSTKTYKLMYFFGTWHTSELFAAESDNEAIFDADESYNGNANLHNWHYPVALWCGNRQVKSYNNNSINGTF